MVKHDIVKVKNQQKFDLLVEELFELMNNECNWNYDLWSQIKEMTDVLPETFIQLDELTQRHLINEISRNDFYKIKHQQTNVTPFDAAVSLRPVANLNN